MQSVELSQILKLLMLNVGFPLGVAALLHFKLDKYPKPLPLSKDRKREIWETLVIWVIPTITITFIIFSSFAEQMENPTPKTLITFSLITMVPYLVIPVLYLKLVKKWTLKDFGFSKPRAPAVVIFAIVFFVGGGMLPLLSSSFKPMSLMLMLFALYQTAFIEEFFFRGIIQGKLERAIGQNKAWFYSGILFGLAHFFFNFFVTGLDLVPGLFMLAQQIIFGWIFGIIYMKTRSLWPSMVGHYLIDGRLASIIARIFF
ncbi:hypothetical protein ES707_05872 [subsurface metagenome]